MDKQELMNQVEQYINSRRDDIVEDLKTLVRIPSISVEGEGSQPFGAECARALDKALSMAKERGFYVNNRDNWYGTAWYGSEKNDNGFIGIFSHLDVVEAGDNWIYEPFEPIEKDGFLIGRGAGDNKSGAVIGMYAMQTVKELNIPLKSSLMLYFGCNEEKGMKDIDRFNKEHLMPDYSMVPDLFFPVCYGEKGNLKLTLQAKSGFETIVDFHGGSAENIVPDKAEAKLIYSSELYEEAVKAAETSKGIEIKKDGEHIVVTAKGKGGHSSMPAGTVDAIWVLASFLKELKGLGEKDCSICEVMADLTGDYEGKALGIDSSDEPSGNLVCAAVTAKMDGTLPEILFNIRYPVTDYRERIESALLKVISGKDFVLKRAVNNDPLYLSEDDPYVQTLMKVYREVTGLDKSAYVIDGGTYARKLKRAVGYGGGNGAHASFLPQGHGRVHQPDEARNIDGILEAIKIYVMSILEIDRMIQDERKKNS